MRSGFKNQDVLQAPEQNSRSGFKNQDVFQAPEQNSRSGFATQPARFLMIDCCPKYFINNFRNIDFLYSATKHINRSSVMDPNTLNLNPDLDPELWRNFDLYPGLQYIINFGDPNP